MKIPVFTLYKFINFKLSINSDYKKIIINGADRLRRRNKKNEYKTYYNQSENMVKFVSFGDKSFEY